MLSRILGDAVARTAAQSGRWADCAERLNSTARPVPDATLRGSGWLITNMPDVAEEILAGIAAVKQLSQQDGHPLASYRNRIARVDSLLDSSGIDWSTDSLQELLTFVAEAGRWDAELLARVRAIGLPKPVVTAEEVRAAWQSHLANEAYNVIRQTRIDWDALSADIRSRIESGQLSRDGVVEAVTQAWS